MTTLSLASIPPTPVFYHPIPIKPHISRKEKRKKIHPRKMMQGDDPNPRIESASYGITTPILPQPSTTTTTTTTTLALANTSFPSASSSLTFFPGRTHPDNPLHPQYQGGLHRRRGSAASDSSSTSASPSSPKPPPLLPPPKQSMGGLTFNPDHLSRQHHGQHQARYQSVVGGNGSDTNGISGNSENEASHALHPNITHHHYYNINTNNKKISGSVFQESTAVGGGRKIAPSIAHTKDNYRNISNNDSMDEVRDTLEPNPKHLYREYNNHPHAQTADSLASLGGGGAVIDNKNSNEEDAEFEVRVIANRTDVTKDNNAGDGNHQFLHHVNTNDNDRPPLPTSFIASGTKTTTAPPHHDPGTGATAGFEGAGEGGARTQKRLQSLDILRGITIIFMVLVNTQGADPFEQLTHTPWFGYTLADWVFPNFIFMVGMAVAIVLSPIKLAALPQSPTSYLQDQQQQQRGVRRVWKRHETRIRMSFKIVKRSCILFAIGIALNALEMIGRTSSDSGTFWIRIPGVLQRIGFCYLVLALSVLWSPVRILGTVSSSPTASANQATRDRAQSSAPSSPAPPISSKCYITPTTTTVVQTTITSSRRVKILLPLLCTLLWFILTYIIQSSATEPILSCLYPPYAISPSSNSTDIIILPGYAPSRGQLSPSQCTAQSVLDTWLFTKDKDFNNPTFDAEGTLGTLMAIVTAWVGWTVGGWVVEQQRVCKVVVEGLVGGYEREVQRQQDEEDEEAAEEEVRRRKRVLVDENPKDTGGRSSFNSQQQQHQSSPQAMDTMHPLTTSFPQKAEILQLRITLHQRTHLLSHLGEWFLAGTCTMFAGTILGWFLPICKPLWTPSFTLYSAGVSITTLCILMYLYDVPSIPSSPSTISTPAASPTKSTHNNKLFTTLQNAILRLTKFHTLLTNTLSFTTQILICYGRNPTLIYILSELVKIILEKIPAQGGYAWVQTVWSWLFFNSFYRFLPPAWASLVFSLVYVLMFAPLLWVLNRKGIFLRI